MRAASETRVCVRVKSKDLVLKTLKQRSKVLTKVFETTLTSKVVIAVVIGCASTSLTHRASVINSHRTTAFSHGTFKFMEGKKKNKL